MSAVVVGLVPAAIPSPSQGVWYLGPLPLRAYALAILAGIVVALWLTTKRWVERGGREDTVVEIAFWAVPFGIVGGRIYHVISSPDAYFGPDGDPLRAFAIWEGGLGIWGAIAFGAVGAWIGTRRAGVKFAPFADALAPGLLLAQAIGRLGNWFNQELFGGPTTLPWGLRIDDAHLPAGYESGTLFHPTFLYELLWNVAAAALIIWLDRRWRLGHGRVFWLYVLTYTCGRLWIEMVRIDPAEQILGVRLNVWTALLLGIGAAIAFVVLGRRYPERETELDRNLESEPPADETDAPAEDPADQQGEPKDKPAEPSAGEADAEADEPAEQRDEV